MSLHPCPFCGSRNLEVQNNAVQWHFVECMDCHTYGPSANVRQTPDQAADVWNKRAIDAAESMPLFASN